jgi:hypothetical protein
MLTVCLVNKTKANGKSEGQEAFCFYTSKKVEIKDDIWNIIAQISGG